MRRPLKLSLIYGSTRPGRLCDVVALWAESEIRRRGGFEVEVLDPVAADFPADADELKRRLDAADVFLIVTPELNHSYPAPLKALIDAAHGEWSGKSVAFVSYGGVSGGLRAVEHLRNVFAELDAHTLRNVVSFAQAWDRFDAQGALREPAGPARAMGRLLDRLAWWGGALRAARTAHETEAAA